MNLQRLLIEMVVLGISVVAMSLLVSKLMGEKNVLSSPHSKDMIIGGFLSGALLHLVFEATGINEWYVHNYKPLLK